jgi:hypothetical protein
VLTMLLLLLLLLLCPCRPLFIHDQWCRGPPSLLCQGGLWLHDTNTTQQQYKQ